MAILNDIEDLKDNWKQLTPLSKVLACGVVLMSVLSLASISDSMYKFKGFIVDGINFYRQVTRPILEWLYSLNLNIFFSPIDFDILILTGLTITSLFRIGLRIPFEDLNFVEREIAIFQVFQDMEGGRTEILIRRTRVLFSFLVCIPVALGCVLLITSESVDEQYFRVDPFVNALPLTLAIAIPAFLLTFGYIMSKAKEKSSLRWLCGRCLWMGGIYIVAIYITFGLIAGISEGWSRV